jgi:hypothetical protein
MSSDNIQNNEITEVVESQPISPVPLTQNTKPKLRSVPRATRVILRQVDSLSSKQIMNAIIRRYHFEDNRENRQKLNVLLTRALDAGVNTKRDITSDTNNRFTIVKKPRNGKKSSASLASPASQTSSATTTNTATPQTPQTPQTLPTTTRKQRNVVRRNRMIQRMTQGIKSSQTTQTAQPSDQVQETTGKWEYFDNGWFAYDKEASDLVEQAYQEYLSNPGMYDVRSVKSGHWHYMVDFVNFKQTNVEHENHTERNIRRV